MRPNITGTLKEAIENLWEAKRNYTLQDIKSRASRVIEMEAMNGTTRLRTHVDVDSIGGLLPLKALLELRKEYADIMDIQVVAFPQEGIIIDEGAQELMKKAMELGANVVGGMPHAELTDDDSKKHIDFLFEVAKEFNADIDSHTDETDNPNSRCIEYLAAKTFKEGYQGRVTADHVCALASYDDYYAAKIIDSIKHAEMTIETNPETNIVLQGRLDSYPKRRGLTRVRELLQRGVNVTFGQDCVKDAFYPFGKADMLGVGFVLGLLEQMTMPLEIETIYDMATTNAAKTIGVTNEYGLNVGNRADIIVIDATSPWEAIRAQPDRLWVLKEGRLISQSKTNRKLIRNN